MFINHSSREVTAKVVYYGPGLSGKTTNLQYIFSVTNPRSRGELISIETEIERTLFFDLLPINVGLINGYQTKFQLYTVPGQVFYDSTRKLVLKGADGIVFVVDSQELMKEANIESLENLKFNLANHKLDINEIPFVFQYNKRDLTTITPIDELNRMLNKSNLPFFPVVATEGAGVLETLRGISTLILAKIRKMLEHPNGKNLDIQPPSVDFSFNKKHKIIEKENLPLKKIHAENLESAAQQISPPGEYQVNLDAKLFDEPKQKYEEEELMVETISEMGELKDMEDIFLLDQDMEESPPLKDLEEIRFDDETPLAPIEEIFPEPEPELEPEPRVDIKPAEVAEYIEKTEDTNEIRTYKGLDEINAEDDYVAFEELEPFDTGTLEDEDLKIANEEMDLLKEPEPPVEKKQVEKKEEEVKKIIDVKLKETPKEAPKEKVKETVKPGKKAPESTNSMDIFERLKDKTRVTVIKEVPLKESRFFIEIKDKNSNLLETIKIDITPETKKVTLILDVKK